MVEADLIARWKSAPPEPFNGQLEPLPPAAAGAGLPVELRTFQRSAVPADVAVLEEMVTSDHIDDESSVEIAAAEAIERVRADDAAAEAATHQRNDRTSRSPVAPRAPAASLPPSRPPQPNSASTATSECVLIRPLELYHQCHL